MKRPACPRCRRPSGFCYCALVPPIDNRREVLILQHRPEAGHPLNTARIAALGLGRCCLVEVDDRDDAGRWPRELGLTADADSGGAATPLLVYPAPGSEALVPHDVAPDTPLLFLDASWRKAKRMWLGSPWLQSLPCRHLVPQSAPRYRVRHEPGPACRSTLEAIVQALGLLGEDATELLTVMDAMVERQLACMPPGVRERYQPDDSNANPQQGS